MNEKKLDSLIAMLLKLAAEQENPAKYNNVIIELMKAENVTNHVIMVHRGGAVVSYQNSQGGISLIGDTQPGE